MSDQLPPLEHFGGWHILQSIGSDGSRRGDAASADPQSCKQSGQSGAGLSSGRRPAPLSALEPVMSLEPSASRAIANLPNSAIRSAVFLQPVDAAQAIIDLRAELDAIYAVVDHSDAALYDAVKQSIARVREWDSRS